MISRIRFPIKISEWPWTLWSWCRRYTQTRTWWLSWCHHRRSLGLRPIKTKTNLIPCKWTPEQGFVARMRQWRGEWWRSSCPWGHCSDLGREWGRGLVAGWPQTSGTWTGRTPTVHPARFDPQSYRSGRCNFQSLVQSYIYHRPFYKRIVGRSRNMTLQPTGTNTQTAPRSPRSAVDSIPRLAWAKGDYPHVPPARSGRGPPGIGQPYSPHVRQRTGLPYHGHHPTAEQFRGLTSYSS